MSAGSPSRSQPKTEKQLGRLVSNYAEASGLGVRRYQIAQKIHAYTECFPDRENERVHDLIDLQLMEGLIDYSRVKAASVEIFDLRQTHSWPPKLTVEPTWPDTYRELVAELDFPTKDLAEAIGWEGFA